MIKRLPRNTKKRSKPKYDIGDKVYAILYFCKPNSFLRSHYWQYDCWYPEVKKVEIVAITYTTDEVVYYVHILPLGELSGEFVVREEFVFKSKRTAEKKMSSVAKIIYG